MKHYAPSYYDGFSCIAGDCKHSCCIGWEIDVDEATMEHYRSVGGGFGRRLIDNIDTTGDCPHFKLCRGERCPFLNKDNLCDISINLGEESLCSICYDHPRYRNFFSDRTEIGLGLCCEAAAELILNEKGRVTLKLLKDDGDNTEVDDVDEEFYALRDKIFGIIQERTLSVNERLACLSWELDVTLPDGFAEKWADILLSLEILDPEWNDRLKIVKASGAPLPNGYPDEIAAEQLLVYFLYRHLADGLYDGRIKERIAFAVLGLKMIFTVSKVCRIPLTEAARAYSSEIEYSEENTDKLLDLLH